MTEPGERGNIASKQEKDHGPPTNSQAGGLGSPASERLIEMMPEGPFDEPGWVGYSWDHADLLPCDYLSLGAWEAYPDERAAEKELEVQGQQMCLGLGAYHPFDQRLPEA